MNPLTLIHEWYLDADPAIRLELVQRAAAYHPTANAQYLGEDEELTKRFEAYLTEELPDKKEVVRRVFFLKSLLEACFYECDTEEGWEKVRFRNEQIFTAVTEKHLDIDTKIYDKFLETYDERKEQWIAWCAQWNELVTGQLRYDHLYYYGLNVG